MGEEIVWWGALPLRRGALCVGEREGKNLQVKTHDQWELDLQTLISWILVKKKSGTMDANMCA